MLEYVRLRLTFEAATDLQLTVFKGSTLRSLFKTSLRNVCCIGSRNQKCEGCVSAGNCPYEVLTEHKTNTGEDTVLPLAISCASIERNSYRKGECFAFDMVLIGKATRLLPYAVASLCNWERLDVGKFQMLISEQEMVGGTKSSFMPPSGKLRFVGAEQVTAKGSMPLYSPGGAFRQPVIQNLSVNETPSTGRWIVTVRFLSPVRIFRKIVDPATSRKNKTLVTPELINFDIFFRALRKRCLELIRHFGEGRFDIEDDQNERVWEAAREVTMDKTDAGLEMVEVRRYDRNLERYKLYGGMMGTIGFRNVAASLIPWIMAGELLQAGKFPAMGYGEYQASYSVN